MEYLKGSGSHEVAWPPELPTTRAGDGATRSRGGGSASGNATAGPGVGDPEIEDVSFARMFAELDARRSAVEKQRPGDLVDFVVIARGGKWTMAKAKVAADCERAHAAHDDAKKWARDYDLNLSFTCSYSEYSYVEASTLCLAWARKMQYLYRLVPKEASGHFVYSDALIDAYREAEDFSAWAAEQTGGAVLARITQIREVRPGVASRKRRRSTV